MLILKCYMLSALKLRQQVLAQISDSPYSLSMRLLTMLYNCNLSNHAVRLPVHRHLQAWYKHLADSQMRFVVVTCDGSATVQFFTE